MIAQPFSCILLPLLAGLVLTQEIQFDGRVASNTKVADFDGGKVFDPSQVFGEGLSLGQLLVLPGVDASLFDNGTVPVEVTISDDSIFNGQTGFRRAEVVPASNDGTDPSTEGVKTVHFSIMKDNQRPLNLSHEYQLFFLESSDFSTNQVVLKTGTILGQDTKNPDTLMFFGNVNDGKLLFSTAFTQGIFHNFAVTLDFNQNTAQVFHSTGSDALKSVTNALPNDNSGQGQFHFGVLKKGVNGGADITKDAEQPAGIDEGVIFGGIFEEDSSKTSVILSL